VRWELVPILLIAVAVVHSMLGQVEEPSRLPTLAEDEPEDEALEPPALPDSGVVSLEPLDPRPAPARMAFDVEPSRRAEHARFHRRVAAPEPVEAPAVPRLRIRDAGELRRAVILAEVLDRPRALRPLDE
jgi:hypothetical protein